MAGRSSSTVAALAALLGIFGVECLTDAFYRMNISTYPLFGMCVKVDRRTYIQESKVSLEFFPPPPPTKKIE